MFICYQLMEFLFILLDILKKRLGKIKIPRTNFLNFKGRFAKSKLLEAPDVPLKKAA